MAIVRKRTLPSSKVVWQADYKDGEGKRRSKQFPTKREADTFLLGARGEVVRGVHVADSASITVAEACGLWLDRADAEGLERSTVLAYRQHVDLHIKPLIGGVKLNKVSVPAVQAFADELAKTRSRAMVKRIVGSLSGVFSEAMRRGKAAQNPVSAVKLRMPKRDKARLEMPTKDELRAILKAAEGRQKVFIYTAAFTGLRSSELRGLQWRDIDLKAGVLTVHRRADAYGKLGSPKSEAGTRDIPLVPTVVSLLTAWQAECPKGELGLVFPNGAGNIESHANLLNRVFWPLQVKAGVVNMVDGKDGEGRAAKVPEAKFSLHALRHAAASLFIEQGMKPKRVQELMGHSSIQMTFDTYGYLFPSEEDDKAAMRAMEERLLTT